jgi:hypothetical protein
MEALLGSLAELVPYTLARVIVPEGGPHLLALGEREIPEPPKTLPKYHPGHPLTLVTDDCQFLKKVLEEKKSVLIPDTDKEKDWQTFEGHTHLRSWLSVPLKASVRIPRFSLDRPHGSEPIYTRSPQTSGTAVIRCRRGDSKRPPLLDG